MLVAWVDMWYEKIDEDSSFHFMSYEKDMCQIFWRIECYNGWFIDNISSKPNDDLEIIHKWLSFIKAPFSTSSNFVV
jgi:hypothetical protein